MSYFDFLFTLIAAAAYTDTHHMLLNFLKNFIYLNMTHMRNPWQFCVYPKNHACTYLGSVGTSQETMERKYPQIPKSTTYTSLEFNIVQPKKKKKRA